MNVIVIPLGAASAVALARRLARTGAAIVLVADDDETAAEAGGLAAELGPGRTAVFRGADGLEEFLQELFGASDASGGATSR